MRGLLAGGAGGGKVCDNAGERPSPGAAGNEKGGQRGWLFGRRLDRLRGLRWPGAATLPGAYKAVMELQVPDVPACGTLRVMKRLTPEFDHGLAAFTVEDLCRPGRITEAVLRKLNQLPPGQFAHQRLEQEVRLLLGMVRDAVCGDYRGLPLTTLADVLNSLHYFLKWRDRCPDTWQGGYLDDLEEVLQVTYRHQMVVDDYKRWLAARAGAAYPSRHATGERVVLLHPENQPEGGSIARAN